jgi:hypothetical protein
VTIGISTPADLDGVLIPMVTRRDRAVGAAAVDFTFLTMPPVKMAWAIREHPRPVNNVRDPFGGNPRRPEAACYDPSFCEDHSCVVRPGSCRLFS